MARMPVGVLMKQLVTHLWTGALEMGPQSLFVRQWMSPVLGTEKPTPSLAPMHLSLAYCFCRIWMLRRYDAEDTVTPKSST